MIEPKFAFTEAYLTEFLSNFGPDDRYAVHDVVNDLKVEVDFENGKGSIIAYCTLLGEGLEASRSISYLERYFDPSKRCEDDDHAEWKVQEEITRLVECLYAELDTQIVYTYKSIIGTMSEDEAKFRRTMAEVSQELKYSDYDSAMNKFCEFVKNANGYRITLAKKGDHI